ncbi:MAG: inner membrane CreD family protein [Chitinophagales bacterium]
MGKQIASVILIFIIATIAWVVLGGTVTSRTHNQDSELRQQVGQLWGSPQQQSAPLVYYQTIAKEKVEVEKEGKIFTETRDTIKNNYVPMEKSRVNVDFNLDYRKKGLLWYSTYRVGFQGEYIVKNSLKEKKNFLIKFCFPDSQAVYDNFQLVVGNVPVNNIKIVQGEVVTPIKLEPGEEKTVQIAYVSQGLDEWWYSFGEDVNQVKDFSLVMNTDFKQIDFPQNSIAPTQKHANDKGWKLEWRYNNLLTGIKIGMDMPKKLNPGPWVASVSYFAPVSLFLFLFMVIIFAVMQGVKIHPMNYAFVSAAFFSFHLLLAYLVDHISIHLAFLICSLVSIFLVVSYMRLVVGKKFAFLQIGVSQFVFLVIFSYTFFFKGYTGLTVTILSIVALFVAMQITAKVDWNQAFNKRAEEKKIIPGDDSLS